MRAAVPTIKKVLAGGGSVILMSHLGRPKNGPGRQILIKTYPETPGRTVRCTREVRR